MQCVYVLLSNDGRIVITLRVCLKKQRSGCPIVKHIFIVNPAAGKCDRSVQIKNDVRRLLGGRGLSYEVLISKGPGDCTRLAREAAESGETLRLYACGGDGTLNEIINGAAGYSNVSVTAFPSGSGNDFIKIFDQPEAFRSLEHLLDCEEASFDLIECRTEDYLCYACNIASIGLDARIGTEMGLYRRWPLVSGKGAYYISTVVNLCKGIHRPYELELNGQVITGDQTLICVCNGRWYGGSFNPVPDAEPDDGLLDVLVIKPVDLLQVAKVIGNYQNGEYADYPHLIRHFRTDRITIRCLEESVINLDGEALRSTEVTFSISERKLRFAYPRGLCYTADKRSMAGSI